MASVTRGLPEASCFDDALSANCHTGRATEKTH
jgi:hypothetical protein